MIENERKLMMILRHEVKMMILRQEVKNRLMSNAKYEKFIKTLVPKTAKEYKMLMQVFAGGYTHANMELGGKL